ncbi:hypothetical protein K7G98_24660, partial [Saccharothrix sp. MB29]|nr:hypothetical protein [Saccharothrix sp. MB29]
MEENGGRGRVGGSPTRAGVWARFSTIVRPGTGCSTASVTTVVSTNPSARATAVTLFECPVFGDPVFAGPVFAGAAITPPSPRARPRGRARTAGPPDRRRSSA